MCLSVCLPDTRIDRSLFKDWPHNITDTVGSLVGNTGRQRDGMEQEQDIDPLKFITLSTRHLERAVCGGGWALTTAV